ncbi:cytoplasmic protein [Enterococcus sp. DIV0170]|uniref:cytoplasmic protein n=1 Tax=Enterococcus sp. DIV0170 TaxID=2774642 RepID=UPI003F269AEC
MEEIYRNAHKYCTGNRKLLKKSGLCGCFYCGALFEYEKIDSWIQDASGDTAECPNCGIDSVLPKSDQYTLSEEFLEKMREVWFW